MLVRVAGADLSSGMVASRRTADENVVPVSYLCRCRRLFKVLSAASIFCVAPPVGHHYVGRSAPGSLFWRNGSDGTPRQRLRRHMFKALMTSRRFAPLFWCQFCSALNDNFLKNALVMLILFGLGGAGSDAGRHGDLLVTLATVVFIAPFFILSALGGELADRYDKASMAARIKLAEIPVAGLAAFGFFLHSVPILFVTLALF